MLAALPSAEIIPVIYTSLLVFMNVVAGALSSYTIWGFLGLPGAI